MKRRVLAFLTGTSLIAILGMSLGIAGGATLFSDDFEDGNASGWSTSGGSWSVVTDGSKVDQQSSTSSNAYSYTGNSGWTDYTIQARVKALAFNGTGRTCGVVARYQSTSNHYYFTLGNDQQLRLGRKSGGSSSVLASKPFNVTAGTWYTLKLAVNGNQLQGYVDGQLQLTANDTAFGAGRAGLVALSASAAFDDILVAGTAAVSPSPTTTPTAIASPSATPVVTPTATPSPTPVATPTASIPAGADIVVAPDGSGDCSTIQAALDRIPVDNSQWVRIYIKNGVYPEHIFITKSYVALIGEDRTNTRIELALNRAEWNKATGVTNTGSGVINIGCTAPDNDTKTMTKITTSDVIIGNLTVENTAPIGSGTVYTHAIRGESSATRISVVSCNVYGMGSDTLALWNTTTGMYYHADCSFKGRIDAICPRGWCYDVGSTYIEVGNSAPIWHEGAPGSGQKFVIRNAYVKPDIAKNFSLLNGQKESTVYLLDSYFYNSAGKTIKAGSVSAAYYNNCHMEGGDQSWHANNLASAPGSPTPSQITAKWTFNNQWDPENTLPAVLPYAAIPQPWNNAYGISPNVSLQWVKAKNAISYNVYLGTAATPAFVANTTANLYQPAALTKGTTYYWRVDAVTTGGTYPGPVWSFTVASN